MAVADVGAVNDAGLVLRQLIVSMGGLCAGAALAFSVWNFRARQPRRLMTAMLLLSYVGIAILTTDHIYRHLLADDAPAWQLWGALTSFALGGVSLVTLLITSAHSRRHE